MSTYGTTVAVDVHPRGDVGAVVAALEGWDGAWRADRPDGWTRITLHSGFVIERVDEVAGLLRAAGTGCAAVAEDHDEYGALWVVLAARPGTVRTVHRRYVLNADPHDGADVATALRDHSGRDPREGEVAGPEAVREAAQMFGVDATAALAAEAEYDRLHERLGVVAGPFPWWFALGLAWPGDEAGTPLRD